MPQTVLEYKCPCCGGTIEFDSSLQKMKCPYCDTEFEVESLKSYDEVLNNERKDDMQWEAGKSGQWQEGEQDDIRCYICRSCGGEIIGDKTTAATSCPFCGNPAVIQEQFTGDLRPDSVIPFKIGRDEVKEILKNHFKNKLLLPRVFKSENHIDEIKGIYVPFWLFNADADASMRYRATRITVWSDSDYNYTRTSFYSVLRSGVMGFDRVPVDGSSKMPDDLMESIEPFDFSQAVDFQTAYLSGYFADRYDVTAEQSVERANRRIKQSAEQAFANTVHGYASVIPEHSSVRFKNGRKSYALYPVWILNTTWQDKKYIFAVNGQTGKIAGDLPVDKKAFWRWFALGSLAVSAVIFGLLLLFTLL